MKTHKTIPEITFVCRAVIPLGLAAIGESWFLRQGWSLMNGLWLFGAAGVCVGWAIENSIERESRSRFLDELERLQGIETLNDEERAAIATIKARLGDMHHERID